MKTITITKDEYERAVADAIFDKTTENDSTKDAKMALYEMVISLRFAKAIEDKFFGEGDDE